MKAYIMVADSNGSQHIFDAFQVQYIGPVARSNTPTGPVWEYEVILDSGKKLIASDTRTSRKALMITLESFLRKSKVNKGGFAPMSD